jgi:hypothetical protein
MGRIARVARVKGDRIVSITMCDLDDADAAARVRGCDYWFEISGELGAELGEVRGLSVGDRVGFASGQMLPASLQASKAKLRTIQAVELDQFGQVKNFRTPVDVSAKAADKYEVAGKLIVDLGR